MAKQIDAQFKLVKFDSVEKFIGIAWNYEHGVLISTAPHSSYTEARAELEYECGERGVSLRWFDGEYHVPKGTDQMHAVCDGSGCASGNCHKCAGVVRDEEVVS